MPYTNADTQDTQLPAGTHAVKIAKVAMRDTAKGEKLLVEYEAPGGFFADWLGFGSPQQSKRTFAYICRLHELAGLPAPTGGSFDEKPLQGTPCQITIAMNDRGFPNLSDFPCAVSSTDAAVPF
jgi:hypothetical protein